MAWGRTRPFLIRTSDSTVPAGQIGVLKNVERLMDAGAEVEGVHESVPVLSSQPANSSVPTSLDSDECQARSRRVGRSSPDLEGTKEKTYLRAPIESPPCQYFCSDRNAMMSGMTDTSAPMMMMPQRLAPPLLLPEA